MKGQKENNILSRQESRHSCRPNVFYFFQNAYFLNQLPSRIAQIAKTPQANAEIKALTNSAILQPFSQISIFKAVLYK